MGELVIVDARRRSRVHRLVLVLVLATAFLLHASGDAVAFTLKLVFPDGQAMTYGSACNGSGCLERGDALSATDDAGEIALPDRHQVIEYRRDGIALSQAPPGTASGSLLRIGDGATVVLSRLLVGAAPATDAAESDLVARINEARAAEGLTLAQLNDRLAASADLQAAWLERSGMTWDHLDLMHVGQYDTTLGFRHAEVSLPDPGAGGEVAATGATSAEAVSDWLASAPHRVTLLKPGPMLIGAARAGGFVVVQTHPPCSGCKEAGPGVRASDTTRAGAPAPVPAAPAPAPAPARVAAAGGSATAGSSATASAPSCGRERLGLRRLAGRRPSVRVRVGVGCLRPGARYMLIVRQNATGRVLATRRIERAGRVAVRLRPSRHASSLRVKLKRDGRAVAALTLSLRRP